MRAQAVPFQSRAWLQSKWETPTAPGTRGNVAASISRLSPRLHVQGVGAENLIHVTRPGDIR
jgi:hypothetical protein